MVEGGERFVLMLGDCEGEGVGRAGDNGYTTTAVSPLCFGRKQRNGMLMSPGHSGHVIPRSHEHALHDNLSLTLVTIILYYAAARFAWPRRTPHRVHNFCQSRSGPVVRRLVVFVHSIRRTDSRAPEDTSAAEKARDQHRQQVRLGRGRDPMPVTEPGIRPCAVRAQQGAAVVAAHHDQEARDFGSAELSS